jgi:hypothetical protein
MNVGMLKQRVKSFEDFSTSAFDQWGERIDAKKLANARASHKRSSEEYIFFLSDCTMFGSAKNSVLATELGVSAKFADELDPLFIAWYEIDMASEETDKVISLFSGGKEYCVEMFKGGFRDGYLDLVIELIDEDSSKYFSAFLSCGDLIDKIIDEDYEAGCDSNSVIVDCDKLLDISPTNFELKYDARRECSIASCDYLGVINLRSNLLCSLGNANQAKTDLLSYIEKCRTPGYVYFSDVLSHSCMVLSEICSENKDFDDAIVFLSLVAGVGDPELQREAKEQLLSVVELKAAYLPEAPKDNRHMILCVDAIPTWPVKEFRFADPSLMRNSKWKFEAGHPQVGEMYICHPLRQDHYFEVQSFHDRLFDEKRTELVYLLESIGASHVHVEARTSSSVESQVDRSTSINSSDETVTGASGQLNRESHDTAKLDTLQFGIEDRELNPSEHPHIPNDLTWYHHEPSWQRIAQSALANRYKTLSVELQYQEDFSVNQKYMTNVQAALKLFKQPIQINWNTETEERLQSRKAKTWKYTAKFEKVIAIVGPQTYSACEAESEYLEDLNDALTGGVIPENIRCILERHRIKLGISVERSNELEQSISEPSFSDEEQEYLQDLDDCYVDGAVSDSALRILVRRRDKLGISETRASEIEAYFNERR